MAWGEFWAQNLTVGNLLSLAAFIFLWLNYGRKGKELEQASEKRITSVETKIEILWTFFTELNKKTAALLISPHTEELDKLLERWINDEKLSHDELLRLRTFLREEERVTAIENGLRRVALVIQISSVEAKLKEYQNK